jgi:hypothetical protein
MEKMKEATGRMKGKEVLGKIFGKVFGRNVWIGGLDG